MNEFFVALENHKDAAIGCAFFLIVMTYIIVEGFTKRKR